MSKKAPKAKSEMTRTEQVKEQKLIGKTHIDYDPKIFYGNLLWTRVKSRAQLKARRIITFELGSDIAFDREKTHHALKNQH